MNGDVQWDNLAPVGENWFLVFPQKLDFGDERRCLLLGSVEVDPEVPRLLTFVAPDFTEEVEPLLHESGRLVRGSDGEVLLPDGQPEGHHMVPGLDDGLRVFLSEVVVDQSVELDLLLASDVWTIDRPELAVGVVFRSPCRLTSAIRKSARQWCHPGWTLWSTRSRLGLGCPFLVERVEELLGSQTSFISSWGPADWAVALKVLDAVTTNHVSVGAALVDGCRVDQVEANWAVQYLLN